MKEVSTVIQAIIIKNKYNRSTTVSKFIYNTKTNDIDFEKMLELEMSKLKNK